ncbi:MAG: hypothetical protein ACRYHA_20810 [Janthinobacterium lividum]
MKSIKRFRRVALPIKAMLARLANAEIRTVALRMKTTMKTRRIARQISLSGFSCAILLTTGCASIVGGMHQSLSVQTKLADGRMIAGASCKLQSSKGTWYVTTPGSVTVHRSNDDLSISCRKSGSEFGNATVMASTRGWMFGNAMYGGVMGANLDASTGAGYRYPDEITVLAGNDIDPLSASPFIAVPVPVAATFPVTETSPIAATLPVAATLPAKIPPPAVTASPPPVSSRVTAPSPVAIAPRGTAIEKNRDDRDASELPAIQRRVAPGVATMVAAHADWENLCKTSGAAPDINVRDRSQHGALEITQGEFAAPEGNARPTCASGNIYGTQIFYTPDPGFHGTDHFRYDVTTATGQFTRVVEIVVR